MRKIHVHLITKTIAELCVGANVNLRADVYQALANSLSREKDNRARWILQSLLDNANCARDNKLAICQDTGLAYVFVQLGQGVEIYGGDFLKAITKGIEQGYKKGGLRNSIIRHPLKRKAGSKFSPAVVHMDIVRGNRLKLTVLPKGFGSENKSAARMFRPTESLKKIEDFIVQKVAEAGPNACPPYVVGVGIGGGFDQAAFLAKFALLSPLNKKNQDKLLRQIEIELLERINKLGIGPMGLGGETTCLGVRALAFPTHIAGLPVAVNISCHALRSASKIL